MKFYIFLLYTVLTSCGTLINPVYNKLPEKEKPLYTPDSIPKPIIVKENNKGKVYLLNKKKIRELIANSDCEYHLVILYAWWCSPCRAELPHILDYFGNKENVKLYFVASEDWRYIDRINNYWKNINYNDATYILDIYEYKHKNNYRMGVNERNKVFLNSLCENCADLGGYPTFILFNNDFDLIFKKAGVIENFNQTFNQIIK